MSFRTGLLYDVHTVLYQEQILRQILRCLCFSIPFPVCSRDDSTGRKGTLPGTQLLGFRSKLEVMGWSSFGSTTVVYLNIFQLYGSACTLGLGILQRARRGCCLSIVRNICEQSRVKPGRLGSRPVQVIVISINAQYRVGHYRMSCMC